MPTKLGAHALRAAAGLSEFARAGAAVIKLVGDWGLARSIPEGTLVIGRKTITHYDAQLQRKSGKTPLQAAQQLVNDLLPTMRANPEIQYWEGHNEPVWNTPEDMAWYAQLEIERMRLMAELGLKCVIGNFATGSPDLALWPAFLPALRAAKAFQAILGLHEYSCPWMWWMTGKYQINPDEDQGDEGWATLRYRKVYRQFLIPSGLGSLPLVITECGIDPLVAPQPPGADSGTWKLLGSFWARHDNEPDKADYYFRQLVWYDRELQKDDYVVGATVFTWGSFGPPWQDFDVAGTAVADKLVDYARADPRRPFCYPSEEPVGPSPVPPLPTARGLPRVQYERTYVLLPPTADAAWARAAVDATWDKRRFTVGASADDAGIGDLDARRVIAVNPQEWPGTLSLSAFYLMYYPGVEFVPLTAASPDELARKLRELIAE